jgi:hypothetical protein
MQIAAGTTGDRCTPSCEHLVGWIDRRVLVFFLSAALACSRERPPAPPLLDAGQPEPAAAIALLSPQSTGLVSTPTPTLRFHLSAGLSSAKIEVCADRGCHVVRWSTDVSNAFVRVTAELPPGRQFWRVRALATDGGEVSSPTWVFRIGRRKATVDTSWLSGWDPNGDGIDDMPLGWVGSFSYGGVNLAQAKRQSAALDGRPCTGDGNSPSCLALGDLRPAGDVDGDGFADALARVGLDGDVTVPDGAVVHDRPHVLLFHGREAGGPEPVESVVCADMAAVVPLGDIDGDGYADVATRCGEIWRMYRGSTHGLIAVNDPLRAPVVSAMDVNGDGLSDVLTGDGLRLGAAGGLGAPLDVAPIPVSDVLGAIARADGTVDFVVRQAGQLTAWHAAPGEVSRVVPRRSSQPRNVRGDETVVVVGDVDGDGFDDVASGAWDRESVFVLPGGPRAPQEPLLRADPIPRVYEPVRFGVPITIGDVNGDGYDDMGVRTLQDDSQDERVYLGGPRGLTRHPTATWAVSNHP